MSKSQIRCWVIYASTDKDLAFAQKEIDEIFESYSFYPEVEWKERNYEPPEGYQIFGAWRHPNPKMEVFAFLLDNPYMETVGSNSQLLLYIVGDPTEIFRFGEKIKKLKRNFSEKERLILLETSTDKKLRQVRKIKLKPLLASVGIFTVIINAFSMYLRKLPQPNLPSKEFIFIYGTLVALTHILALTLLILILLICMIYTCKYSMLLFRKI